MIFDITFERVKDSTRILKRFIYTEMFHILHRTVKITMNTYDGIQKKWQFETGSTYNASLMCEI